MRYIISPGTASTKLPLGMIIILENGLLNTQRDP